MKFLEFPVRNYQFTVVLFAMLVALGLTSWFAIPRGEDPPLHVPTFIVIAVYPGASPTDLERLVVREVEERLDALDNVKKIESRILDGVATVQVEFEADENPDDRYDEVLREMNALRPELPADLAQFSVEEFTTLDVAIAQVALVSETAPYHELDRLAEQLEDQLTALPGVREAKRWGVPERQVDVALDLGRLSRLSLPPSRILQAIGGESVDLPAGRVEAGARVFNVKTSGSYETPEQVGATVIGGGSGRLIRVRDVASVRWGYKDSTYRALYNGQRAVFVTVTQQDGQNINNVRNRVWAALDAFEADLPSGVTLERGFDQAQNVTNRLSRLGVDLMIAIGLVLITLLPLGLRAAAIVMVSIPLSLAIGVALLRFTGFTIAAKRDQLIARAKTAETQAQVMDAMKSIDLLDPTSEISRFEEKVRREEAKALGAQELAASSLDAQFEQLDTSDESIELEARLAALKAGTGAPRAVTSGQ